MANTFTIQRLDSLLCASDLLVTSRMLLNRLFFMLAVAYLQICGVLGCYVNCMLCVLGQPRWFNSIFPHLCWRLFNYKWRCLGRLANPSGRTLVVLTNHRCWADFFLDVHVTEGRAFWLARWMVAIGLPTMGFVSHWSGVVYYFKRWAEFFPRFKRFLAHSEYPAVVLYPEGMRYLQDRPRPLRTGFMRFSYVNDLPVQVVISRNKETVFCETRASAQAGVTFYTNYGQMLDPRDFATVDDFIIAINLAWVLQWDAIYSPSLRSLTDDYEHRPVDQPFSDAWMSRQRRIRLWSLYWLVTRLSVWAVY